MESLFNNREAIVQKKKEEVSLEFAGFWRRMAAFLIDFITLAVISSIISSIFAPFQWFSFAGFWDAGNAFNEPIWRALPYLVFGNFVSLVVDIAYFVGFWIWRGQTPGKMLLSIKLIHTDASNVNIGAALLRCLGYVVSTAVLFIGFIWIAFDSRKQGFHDKIADTYVVKIPPAPITAPATKASVGG